MGRVEDADRGASLALRLVEGIVRAGVQVGPGDAHARRGRDARGEREATLEARVAARLETVRQDPPGDGVGLLGHGPGHQHGELVAADPERAVGTAQRAPEQLGDLGEGLVADGVAGRVVDELEVVEVDEDERDQVAVAPDGVQLAIELLLECPVVAEPGERIDERVRVR